MLLLARGHASVPAGLAGVVEGAVAEPNCHAGALALVDNRHLKVPDEHIAGKRTVRLHGADVVVVVSLALVCHCQLVLVHLDQVRSLLGVDLRGSRSVAGLLRQG